LKTLESEVTSWFVSRRVLPFDENTEPLSSRIAIERATVDHEPDILPLMVAFNSAEQIAWRPETMIPALRELLQRPDLGLILLARDPASRACIGYAVATHGYDIEFSGADAFIAELFVEPSSRGRGVGRELLDATVRALRARGTCAVHLMVRPENEKARALYEQRGFQVIPRLLMTKSLADDS
jgi:ribosomal protein S18 acetylase RimI-like enzyme